ncbi:AAA domain [Actinobacteria bacterium IMCC26256]|nr:AAA domain [Actinobacteria bacterium IMCC26256]
MQIEICSVVTCSLGEPWESALVSMANHPAAAIRIAARCSGPGEALGVALREQATVVVGDAVRGWWDRDVIQHFISAGIVVAIIGTDAPPGALSLPDSHPEALVQALRAIHTPVLVACDDALAQMPLDRGRIVAVWGGHGSPGRTTISTHLAASAQASGLSTLLIDADTWAPSVAQHLGLDEGHGLVQSVRSVSRGDSGLSHVLKSPRGVSVLVGIARPELWTEIQESSFIALIDEAAAEYDLVVIDVAAPIEEDEELSFDQAPYRRNLVTRSTLTIADRVFQVAGATPVALRRAISATRSLALEIPTARANLEVVLNGAPRSRNRLSEIESALTEHLEQGPIAAIPNEPLCESALWEGQLVSDAAPRSQFCQGINALTERSVA